MVVGFGVLRCVVDGDGWRVWRFGCVSCSLFGRVVGVGCLW